jgi:osmotically-inducible protein OsmY
MAVRARTNKDRSLHVIPTSDHPAAGELRSAVLSALNRSGYTALAGIVCEVNESKVTLSGAVRTYHLKQMAQECAQRVDGVRAVDNRVAVFG